jgi:3-phosphoshikimate 1-carboxyvinyltransferase
MTSWRTPASVLDCANSGTTLRLLTGALAGSQVVATLTGDASLRRRPMGRVVDPLRAMGAQIESHDGRAPLTVEGTPLNGRPHVLVVPSAQVKSALLLAGLHASGPTSVSEPLPSRDHTERLLRAAGARLESRGGELVLEPSDQPLQPLTLDVPGDFSSAAFFLAAAAVRPGWSLTVQNVGLNPTRTAFLKVLTRMGADVRVTRESSPDFEPRGDVTVVGAHLRNVTIDRAEVAGAMDEIPVLLVLASQADGVFDLGGAGELRVKESDRLSAMSAGLRAMGATVEERQDGLRLRGRVSLRGVEIDSHGDHRIAMAFAVASLVADAPTHIVGSACVAISYPGFFDRLAEIAHGS